MRLRNVLAAAVVGASALVMIAPTCADAADGAFTYRYDAPDGNRQLGILIDPGSGVCIPLREVTSPSALAADTPTNHTDARAEVFTGPACDGDSFSLRARDGHGSDRLKLRSVKFG